MAGNGVIQSGAAAELRAFAERMAFRSSPHCTAWARSPRSTSCLSACPACTVGFTSIVRFRSATCCFNIGGRFDDRVTGKVASFAPRAQIIHVDIDASEIWKVVPTSIGIHGDARATLTLHAGARARL